MVDMLVEKLRKVIKDELDLQNVVIKQADRVKQNNDNNDNSDQNRKPSTVVAKLLHLKDKQDILHEAKSREIRIFFKEDFSRAALIIMKVILMTYLSQFMLQSYQTYKSLQELLVHS